MKMYPSFPKAFILLILATSWLNLEGFDKEIEILELFAGQARLTRLSKSLGFGTAAHDIDYDPLPRVDKSKKSAMDINGSAGFVLLDSQPLALLLATLGWSLETLQQPHWQLSDFLIIVGGQWSTISLLVPKLDFVMLFPCWGPIQMNYFRPIDAPEPRLILHSILNCRFGNLLALVGVLCSTWVAVNAGTSQRDVLTPMGHPEYPSVQSGNIMVSRLGLLITIDFDVWSH